MAPDATGAAVTLSRHSLSIRIASPCEPRTRMPPPMIALLSIAALGGLMEPGPDSPYDWLIAGGRVVDGTGAPGRVADVLIRGGRIAFIGDVDPDTLDVRNRFDATGLVIAPGFIDAHAHGDPLGDPAFASFLAMGVTTIVLGQDGGGPAVARLAAHLDAVDHARPGVNVAYLVGHNTVRRESGVAHHDPDAGGLERMARLVAAGLDAGAFGLSTGLEYDPGVRAGPDELAVIAAPVAARGGVVMSHMRSEDTGRVVDAVAELIEQGRRSGARVHASHLKVVLGDDPAEADRLLETMAAARADGIAITGDVYPYTASFTGLAILFPEWARPPHDYAAVVRDRGAELATHLRNRVEARNGPEATLLGTGKWAGKTLAEVAALEQRPFEDLLLELGPGGASAAYFVMDESVMARFLADPHVVVSSDGSPTMLHPRGYGSFARVIRRYVVEDELLSLEEAVRRMAGLTASIVGLDDPARVQSPRGQVRVGWAADLVAFDPREVQDRAGYDAPHRLAEGMRMVWVGGDPAWQDGARAGRDGNGNAIRSLAPERR
jgi:N-acyl-D-amino-acid deacylase